MYIEKNKNIEELKKRYTLLNLYDLLEVSKFCKKLLNLELRLNEEVLINIISFSISALFDNSNQKFIYIIDLNYTNNKREYSEDLEEFMQNFFNLKLNY